MDRHQIIDIGRDHGPPRVCSAIATRLRRVLIQQPDRFLRRDRGRRSSSCSSHGPLEKSPGKNEDNGSDKLQTTRTDRRRLELSAAPRRCDGDPNA